MFRFIVLVSAVFAIGICGRHSGERNSGEQGVRGGRGGHGPPPFLRNVTEEARKEFFTIVKSQNETISAQKQQVQVWAQKYGVLDQVNEFDANMTRFKTELNKNVTELISQLSQGQQQFSQIMGNENQTREEQRQAIDAFRNQSRNVFETLKFMGGVFRPRGGPHRPDGDFGGRGGKGGQGGKGSKGDQKQGKSRGGF